MRFSPRMKEIVRQVNNEDFLLGGGEMGALMRSHDWMKTPLGTPHEWPPDVGAGDEIVKVGETKERMTVAEINALLYSPNHPRDVRDHSTSRDLSESEDGGPPSAYHPASDVHLVGAGADSILQ
jgi:hypothetical protein